MSQVEYQALSWVSGVCFKMETPKNLVNIFFLSKLSFDKLSWLIVIWLRNFFVKTQF
jgi:hypothetical protein